MKHYLVIESSDLRVLTSIRKLVHEASRDVPSAELADIIYPGDQEDYYWIYEMERGALARDREVIARVFQRFMEHARQVAAHLREKN